MSKFLAAQRLLKEYRSLKLGNVLSTYYVRPRVKAIFKEAVELGFAKKQFGKWLKRNL